MELKLQQFIVNRCHIGRLYESSRILKTQFALWVSYFQRKNCQVLCWINSFNIQFFCHSLLGTSSQHGLLLKTHHAFLVSFCFHFFLNIFPPSGNEQYHCFLLPPFGTAIIKMSACFWELFNCFDLVTSIYSGFVAATSDTLGCML